MWPFTRKQAEQTLPADEIARLQRRCRGLTQAHKACLRANAGQNPEDSCVRLDVALVECLAASIALPEVAKFQECYAATAQSGIPPGSALDECSQYVSSMRKHLKQLGLYPVK